MRILGERNLDDDIRSVTRIAVLITCHNRKQTTMACLDALFGSDLPRDAVLDVVLVDDGSTDGTSDAVEQRYPSVVIERGDGSLFWNRGMHRAQTIAMQYSPDFILWLNDDTTIHRDSLVRMLDTYRVLVSLTGRPVVVVGATVDQVTNKLTYAGMEPVSWFRRFKYRKVWHPEETRECQAMNGNIVLIPRMIVERLGNLDPVFEHAMGDSDYALRARKAGFRIFVAPGSMGYCSNNPSAGTFTEERLPITVRWRRFVGRKGLPPRSWLHFTYRHGGVAWPLFFAWPYVNFFIKHISRKQ